MSRTSRDVGLAVVTMLTAALVSLACSSGSSVHPRTVADGLQVRSVEWSADGGLLLFGTKSDPARAVLARVDDPEGSSPSVAAIAPALPGGCRPDLAFSFGPLRDADVERPALVTDCFTGGARSSAAVDYDAWDFAVGHEGVTFGYRRPDSSPVALSPTEGSRAADGTVYTASEGPSCSTLWQTDPAGSRPVDVLVGEGQGQWSNAAVVEDSIRSPRLGCGADAGIAVGPEVSPDSRLLAFAGTNAGADGSGSDYRLYVLELGSTQPTEVADGLRGVLTIRWSKDQDRLLIAGVGGVQIIDRRGHRTRVVSRYQCAADWSPDETKIAAACFGAAPDFHGTELYVVDDPG